jgi:hypothetical protein
MTSKKWRGRGGFYPSVMSGVVTTGQLFIPATIAQGFRLLRNNKTRMASRRKHAGRRTKRTKRS